MSKNLFAKYLVEIYYDTVDLMLVYVFYSAVIKDSEPNFSIFHI